MMPDDFIAMLAQPARATQAATGIPASFMIAHAAVESDWFNCVPALEACNLFGMTAGSTWRGATLTDTDRQIF
ncbi:MAG TPA: glucosaminidase domain-containing protein [Burkholderiaceae bacterium]